MKSTLIIGSSVCDVNIYVQQFPQITGDENIIKQEIITIGAMFNNKMYYLSHYKVIDESTKKRLIHNFNIIFKQNIKEYKLEFTNEDLFKITELVNKTKERLES